MNDILRALAERLKQLNYTVTTAESCTAGGISYALTALSGSSAWFERAYTTYSNDAKVEMLGVLQSSIDAYGVVSEVVVSEMATGAILQSNANCSIAVSGIAGPHGGTLDKPLGTVCFGWAIDGVVECETCVFSGQRDEIRAATIEFALKGLLQRL